MKIGEVLVQARECLRSYGIESAMLDASLILSHVTNLSKTQLLIHEDDELDIEVVDAYARLIEKRTKGYPVAYILGYKDFYDIRLKVTEKTLIPRPDTEILVEKALSLNPKGRVLDVGTGSGAIILALKKHLGDQIEAFACDIDMDALEVAEENCQALNLDVTYFESDFLNCVPNEKKYSMIVSNPPYIHPDDPHLRESSLPFEPRKALESGYDGLEAISILTREAPAFLENNGYLLIEHGYNQAIAAQRFFKAAGFNFIQTIKDYGGNDRVTLGRYTKNKE